MAPSAQQVFGNLVPFAEHAWARGLPSPYYKDSHVKLRAAMREWTKKYLMDVAYDWDENREIDHDVYQQLARDGLLLPFACGNKIGKEYAKFAKPDGTVFGGVKVEEWDGFHDAVLIDEMNRCASLGVTQGLLAGLQIGLPPVMHFGSQKMKDQVIPEVLSGTKRVCLAITEPEAGSDVANLSCEAKKTADGKHYIVNGTKKWITNGVWSDYFCTAVRTSGKAGEHAGVSFLLIPRSEGVKTKKMLMGGSWCAGTTFLTFEDVKVPVENILGEEGKGFKMIMTNFIHERLMIVLVANSMSRVCVEDAVAYASKRVVFGKRLLDSEVIRDKLAHMSRMIESQQAWTEAVIYATDNLSVEEANNRMGGITSLLKVHAAEVLEHCSRESVQVFGGKGHTRGGEGERVERIRRDCKGVTIPGGSSEILAQNAIKQELKIMRSFGARL